MIYEKDPNSQCSMCLSYLDCMQKKCCLSSCVHFVDKLYAPQSSCDCSLPSGSALSSAFLQGPSRQKSCPHFRATASLPDLLDFVSDQNERVVISRVTIPVRSIFGPLMESDEPKLESKFDNYRQELNNQCNWMKFVRQVPTFQQQNLTAFQLEGKTYFAVIKQISVGEELRVRCAESCNLNVSMPEKLTELAVQSPDSKFKKLSMSNETPVADARPQIDKQVHADSVNTKRKISNQEENCAAASSDSVPDESRAYVLSSQLDILQSSYSRGLSSAVTPENLANIRKRKNKGREHVNPHKFSQSPAAFRANEKLQEHLHVKHDVDRTEKYVPFKCKTSGQECRHALALDEHVHCEHNLIVKNVEFPKSKKCVICLIKCSDNVALRDHYRTHVVDEQYACRICNKLCKTRDQVRRHQRVHKPKVLACEICGQSSNNPSHLKGHMRMHFEADLECPFQCGMKFKRKTTLRKHIQRLHSRHDSAIDMKSEKVLQRKKRATADNYEACFYKCRECRIGFALRVMLITHLESHHPDLPKHTIPELNLPLRRIQGYRCRICLIYFLTEEQAQSHVEKKHLDMIRSSSEEHCKERSASEDLFESCMKPYNTEAHWCEICESPFNRGKLLLDHAKKAHPEYFSILMPNQQNDKST